MLTLENTFTEYPNIVSTKDLREMLNIGRSTCLKLLSSKEIKSVRIGRVYKIPKVNIIEYLNRKQND